MMLFKIFIYLFFIIPLITLGQNNHSFDDTQLFPVQTYTVINKGQPTQQTESKYGYINKKGKLVIPYLFDRIEDFSEGFAAVYSKKENAYAYINLKGDYLTGYIFSKAQSFNEGFASVCYTKKYYDQTKKNYSVFKNCTLINHHGKNILDPVYEDVNPVSDGFSLAVQEKKYFYIEPSTLKIYSCPGLKCGDFSHGTAPVLIGNKWGLINKKRDILFKPAFDSIGIIRNNPFYIVSLNGKKGIIHTDGKVMIPVEHDQIHFLFNSIFVAENKNKFILFNNRGDAFFSSTIPFIIYGFSENIALLKYRLGKNKPCFQFIDFSKKHPFNDLFHMASLFSNGQALVAKNNQEFILDRQTGLLKKWKDDKPILKKQNTNYKKGESLYVLAPSGINLREEPDDKSKVISIIDYGEKAIILDDETNGKSFQSEGIKGFWVKMEYQGKTGYVFSGFLSRLPLPDLVRAKTQISTQGIKLIHYYQNQLKQPLWEIKNYKSEYYSAVLKTIPTANFYFFGAMDSYSGNYYLLSNLISFREGILIANLIFKGSIEAVQFPEKGKIYSKMINEIADFSVRETEQGIEIGFHYMD